ncbi:glycoside hydrolase family 16 protein [Lentithecium fluviatile CBS 122367]|uniref:Glycoside hydrolase family 16 protein n=1 Tax=Lentithecium fluviatile CBS 122367 TaxID=1168545 RepID=A0A6G1JHH1_9PLEO|nr:glycoside hydrolase family 16 protein [Lentithecium fluviatile CBS 122367]
MEVRPKNENYFKSRRIKKGTLERPWMHDRDPRDKWHTIIPCIGLAVGVVICAFLIWDGLRSVVTHKYCPVLEEDFLAGFNGKVWSKEVEVGGFGNGEFQQTTNTDENVFVRDGVLHIKPTLQDAALIENDTVIDLRGKGCTGTKFEECVTVTNTTNGTIVNPVKSARINTKLSASIRFGRVEVVAKLPAGDWIWPAIWLLPKDNKYGDWPRSGEIDIAETRGNNWTYPQGGNNVISSALHFGPNAKNDGWWRNNVKRRTLHTTYSAGFNTFGIEASLAIWNEKYIFTYVNTRLLQVMFTQFNQPFWSYGKFPLSDSNGTRLINPWANTGSNISPFDQDFYLILDVAVGGTDGWFADGKAGKPWIDASLRAKRDFWQSRDDWYHTWREQGWMEVKSVKMWQQEGYNGCDSSNAL